MIDHNDKGWRNALNGVVTARTPGERDNLVRTLKESPPPTKQRPDASQLPRAAAHIGVFKPVFRFVERSNFLVEEKTKDTHAPVSRDAIWLVGLDEASAAVFAHQPDVVVELEGRRYVLRDPPHWRNVQHGWRVGLVPTNEP